METKAKVIIAIVIVVLLCSCLGILFAVLGGMGILSGKKEETTPEIKKDETKPEEKPVAPAATSAVGVNGRYVKLVRPTVGSLNLAEIVIKSSADGANIAKSATVTKSSAYIDDMFPVANLIDDKLDNFVHTSGADAPWILIDLGKVIPIYSIVLTNRNDCCQGRTTGLILSILDDAQKVVYTADPLVSQSGNTTPTEDVRDGSYMVYTWTLPNKTAIGSQPLPGYQPVVADPCGTDPNAINLSKECVNKLWKEAGCTTPSSIHITESGDVNQWAKDRTKQALVNDYKLWATLTDDVHRKGCYK